MTDEEILVLVDEHFGPRQHPPLDDCLAFARAIAAAEREACAKLWRAFSDNPLCLPSGWPITAWQDAIRTYRDAIRARGESDE